MTSGYLIRSATTLAAALLLLGVLLPGVMLGSHVLAGEVRQSQHNECMTMSHCAVAATCSGHCAAMEGGHPVALRSDSGTTPVPTYVLSLESALATLQKPPPRLSHLG